MDTTQRTVTFQFSEEDKISMQASTNTEAFNEAITRLTLWGQDSPNYQFCTIAMRDATGARGAPEFIACYWDEAPKQGSRPRIVIGAVWNRPTIGNSGHFSFHS